MASEFAIGGVIAFYQYFAFFLLIYSALDDLLMMTKGASTISLVETLTIISSTFSIWSLCETLLVVIGEVSFLDSFICRLLQPIGMNFFVHFACLMCLSYSFPSYCPSRWMSYSYSSDRLPRF
jgi:hypothetical protein